jgi:hypothetical protein
VTSNADAARNATVNADRAAAYQFAQRIRTGKTAAFRPAGAFEAVGREVEGQPEVWARYVGVPTEQAEDGQQ